MSEREREREQAQDILSDGYFPLYGGHLAKPVRILKTPFPSWNSASLDAGMGQGPVEGWFTVIGGNPGHGKTVIALNLAAQALEQGYEVAIASMEMSRHDIAPRVYKRLLGTDEVTKIGRGEKFSRSDFESLQKMVQQTRDAYGGKLYVNRKTITDKKDLFDYIRYVREKYGVTYVLVDYIQLACFGADDRIHAETVEVVNRLSREAHEKQIKIDALSQFKRTTAEDYTRAPTAQGLYGGMIVEAASDQIGLIDHSRWQRDDIKPHLARTWYMLDKNRYGPDIKGHGEHAGIPIEFNFRTMTVREAYHDEIRDWPTRKKPGASG